MTNELAKRVKMWAVAALTGAAFLGGSVGAQGADFGIETSVDFMSKYISHGTVLTDEPVIQPSVTLTYGDFGVNFWGNIDTTSINEDNDDAYNLQEVDYTLFYGFAPSEALEMEIGVATYICPGTPYPTTSEAYVTATLPTVPLCPSLTVYYDFDECDSAHATLSVGHSFALSEKLALSLGADVGYADADTDVTAFSTGKLHDMSVSAGLDYAINENVSIAASLAYIEKLIDDDDDSDNVVGGLNLTFVY
jgi:hypothetical protein